MHHLVTVLLANFRQLNWVDYLIVLTSLVYIILGYASGFVSGVFDVMGFLVSFVAGLKFYKPLGDMFTSLLHVPQSITHIIAFAVAAIVAELLLRFLERHILLAIHSVSFARTAGTDRLNKYLGMIPGFFSGIILTAFFLTVLIVLPVAGPIKAAIDASSFGTFLVSRAQGFEDALTTLLGGKSDSLLTFFTIDPEQVTTVDLHFIMKNGIVDSASEQEMFARVNAERENAGLQPLVFDESLQEIARQHSQDMLARGYFSHYTPEGKSPFDRMNDAGITFIAAGENLAFSANTTLAMQGLMASPGHRANILSGNYHRIGIGVIDAGIYGKMFSQEFTN